MAKNTKHVLDTNRLLDIWHGRLPLPRRFDSINSIAMAIEAAKRWLRVNPDYGIVTPVRLEYLGGARNREELIWYDAFLEQFELFDEGAVLKIDWDVAQRLARRVPRSGRARGAMDCLILAICKRIHASPDSSDTGLPK